MALVTPPVMTRAILPPMQIPARSTTRRAMTVAEVLVSIVLLGVGVLGLASTSVYATRSAAESARQSYTASRLAIIADSLRATPCGRISSGSGGPNPLHVSEAWEMRGVETRGVVAVRITIGWRGRDGAARGESLEASIACR